MRDAIRAAMIMTWSFQWTAAVASAVGLLMVSGCASTRYDRPPGEFVEDKALIRRVKHALNAQPVYKFPDVKVQTYRGVVQLSGFVASPIQRQGAEEIARRVRGVEKVENVISLAPIEQLSWRDYIPGREETNTNQPVGAPSSGTGTSGGSVTNSAR